MKMRTITVFFLLGATTAAISAEQSGPDISACRYTPEVRQSLKDFWARQLAVLDPEHAVRMTQVAAAIIDGQINVLRADIAAGLSPDAILRGGGGDMPLLALAVSACQESISRELVTLGASPEGNGDYTPLVLAAAKGQDRIAEFLIQHGASVEKTDVNGHTALEDAVRQHQLAAAQVLLKHGGNPNRRVGGGGGILDLASRSTDATDQAIAKELRAYGGISALSSGAQ
ncbi:MAG: ankyrin repeat domain-containing protein [Steroidobacteraceae bacterium]